VCDESRLPGLQGVVAQQCAATTRTAGDPVISVDTKKKN